MYGQQKCDAVDVCADVFAKLRLVYGLPKAMIAVGPEASDALKLAKRRAGTPWATEEKTSKIDLFIFFDRKVDSLTPLLT